MAASHDEWCKNKGVDPSKAVVLQDVDAATYSKGTVEAHLKSLGDDGQVVDHHKVAGGNLEVLCTLKDLSQIPSTYTLTVADDPPIVWKVIRVVMPQSFDAALQALLQQYGKSKSDVASPAADAASISSASRNYRRLRQFSGKEPTTSGELPYETWRQLAEQMVAEPTLTDVDKKSRVVESLLPPALGIVRQCPTDSTAQDILKSLRRVYGAACDGEDLYAAFRSLYQEQGEKPSTYLTRLDEKLRQVLEYEGIEPSRANRSLITQFIRGCIFDEPLVYALQLRQQRDNPPDFLALLHAVRAEEEDALARDAHRHKEVRSKAAIPGSSSELDSSSALAKQVKELTEEIALLRLKPHHQSTAAMVASVPPPSGMQKELDSLRNMVRQLQSAPPAATTSAGDQSRRGQGRGGRQNNMLCYQCCLSWSHDERMHCPGKCAIGPAETDKAFPGKRGRTPEGEQSDVQPVKSSSAATNNEEHITGSTKCLPKGLVGEPRTTQIRVDCYPCMGLLDSGSQVTCVAEYVLRKYLPTKELLPLRDLVVTGAGGQDVPYLGYVNLDISVDRKETGLNVTESTLALVTPGGDDQSMVIIGTNTSLVDRLLQRCREKGGTRFLQTLKVSSAWSSAFKSHMNEANHDKRLGSARMLGAKPLTIPGGQCRTVKAFARNRLGRSLDVLVEELESSDLPDGIQLTAGVMTLKAGSRVKFKVTLSNSSAYPVTVPARARVGGFHIPESVRPCTPSDPIKVRSASTTVSQYLLAQIPS